MSSMEEFMMGHGLDEIFRLFKAKKLAGMVEEWDEDLAEEVEDLYPLYEKLNPQKNAIQADEKIKQELAGIFGLDFVSREDKEKLYTERLKEVCEYIKSNIKKVDSDFRVDSIPTSKVYTARTTYAPNVEVDDVIALKDTTLWNSGKEGMIFTKDRVYYRMDYQSWWVKYIYIAGVSGGSRKTDEICLYIKDDTPKNELDSCAWSYSMSEARRFYDMYELRKIFEHIIEILNK